MTFWALLGPTASGKTEVAVEIAEATGRQIVNVDSRQLYLGMDIGTAKPTREQRTRVPHHMLDVITPDVRWDAMTYARAAREVIEGMVGSGVLPIVVGGSGFYFAALSGALTEGLPPRDDALREALRAEAAASGGETLLGKLRARDPQTAARLHPHDTVRIVRALEVIALTGKSITEHAQTRRDPWGTWRVAVLTRPRDQLKASIRRRVDEMLARGWVDEVRTLLASGYDESSPGMTSLGYPEIVAYVRGALSFEEARERVKVRTWQYARRQLTWCRRFPPTHWVEASEVGGAVAKLLSLFEGAGA